MSRDQSGFIFFNRWALRVKGCERTTKGRHHKKKNLKCYFEACMQGCPQGPSKNTSGLRSRPPFTGVLLGPGPESAPRSAFWAILGTCLGVPQRVFFECFLAFFGPKKHSKSTLWGTPRQVPKIAQKNTPGGTFRPGP